MRTKKRKLIDKSIRDYIKNNLNKIITLGILRSHINKKCGSHLNEREIGIRLRHKPIINNIIKFKHKSKAGTIHYIFTEKK